MVPPSFSEGAEVELSPPSPGRNSLRMSPIQRIAALAVVITVVSGCKERKIEVIEFDARGLGMHYAVDWDEPEGYYPVPPGQFREAAYRKDSAGGRVEISVSSLSGAGGGIMANVNRWRAQVGLQPLAEESLANLPVREFAGIRMFFIDALGLRDHIQGAIIPVGEETWFFKFSGPVDLVAKEEGSFLTFMESIKSGSVELARAPKVAYDLPEGWEKSESESAIRAVTLRVPVAGDGGEPMELIVVPMEASASQSMTIDMWRSKLGKEALGEGEGTKPELVGQHVFTLFDEEGEGKRLLGALCDLEGLRWHFEISGDPESIAAQQENFLKFLASVTFDDGSENTN